MIMRSNYGRVQFLFPTIVSTSMMQDIIVIFIITVIINIVIIVLSRNY
jgi:hypothetical protein